MMSPQQLRWYLHSSTFIAGDPGDETGEIVYYADTTDDDHYKLVVDIGNGSPVGETLYVNGSPYQFDGNLRENLAWDDVLDKYRMLNNA